MLSGGSSGGYEDGFAVMTRSRVAAYVDQMDWYRRCLEDVADGRPVRNLDVAKASYDRAREGLLRYAGLNP